MDNLKDILNQCKVEPSADCWDKLSTQLDAMLPQGSTAPGDASSAASAAGKTATHAFLSSGVKIAAAVIGTAAVATAITFAVINHDPSEEATPQATESAQTETATEVPEESVLDFTTSANQPSPSELSNKRWNKPKNDTIVLQEYYNCNTNELQMNYNSNTNTIQDKTIQDNTVNKTRKPKKRSSVVYDNAYRWEAFWNAYPRKAGKESAYSLWTSLQPTDEMENELMRDFLSLTERM